MNKKKRICQLVSFALPVDHRMKMKVRKMLDKYLDLAREMKKLWNMWVTVTAIIVGTLGTVHRRFGKETGGFGNQRKNRDHSIVEESR